jgi:Beta propeller domain
VVGPMKTLVLRRFGACVLVTVFGCGPSPAQTTRAAVPAPARAAPTAASAAPPPPVAPSPQARPAVAFPVPRPGVVTPIDASAAGAALEAARLESGSCESSRAAAHERAQPLIRKMKEDVEQRYQDYVSNLPECWRRYRENEEYWKAVKRGQGHGGLSVSGIGVGGGGRGMGIGLGSIGTIGYGGASGPRVAQSMSKTNTQVAEVDEPDLVKTDGRYLYLSINGALRIVEALNPRVLSVTRVGGKVRELFVEGDRAVVYSSHGQRPSQPCKYGYDCRFGGDGSSTSIRVFDVRDRTQPKLVRELELSGSLITSRRIGNTVHTVVADGDADAPPYDDWIDVPECGVKLTAVRKRVEALKQRNVQKILEHVAHWGPTLEEKGKTRRLCERVYATQLSDGAPYTTLVSFDLSDDARAAVTTSVRSRPGAVFASTGALYLAVADANMSRAPRKRLGSREISQIHKFQLGKAPEDTRYLGSGVIPGHVISQFSMDEWYGYLRVASSRGRVPDPDVNSVVSVLAENAQGNLVRVGAIEDIAPGEDIRAVRFEGERGYVVTFKKTDPLFVIDLLEPAQPKLLGELKIPGFSTYMQRVDKDHLISIGFDADDRGGFAYFDGLLLQLFDVKTPTEPKLLFREKIGSRGSGSAAATDHLAFNYFAERGLLAIPATVCSGGGNGQAGSLELSGLLVYDVSVERGFRRLGSVDHGRGGDCNGWWSKSTSHVQRSVFLDQLVYSIATDRAKVQSLDRLGTDLADLDLERF